jgi:L-iditol 2-dehydrogenase
MLAVAVSAGGGARVVDLPEPELPPGGVRARVRACGLCGSDVEKLARGWAPAGAVLGHEVAAEVLDGGLAPGARIALAHHVPCGACERCAAGHEPLCELFRRTELVPGGFAERLAASADHVAACVVPLPDAVDDDAATFAEPLSCVLRAIDGLPEGPGLVVGCGSVGLLFCMALAGRDIAAIDPRADRLALAIDLGSRPLEAGDRPAWAVVTAPAGLAGALATVDGGGTVVAFAADGAAAVDVDDLYRRELTLRGVRSGTPRHLRDAVDLLARGAVSPGRLVTHRLPLAEFERGLALYRSGEALKVLFTP